MRSCQWTAQGVVFLEEEEEEVRYLLGIECQSIHTERHFVEGAMLL